MRFEWDPEKERSNLEKHGISFGRAIELFSSGVEYLEIYDERHSEIEDRFIAIGPLSGRIIVMVYSESSEDTIRVISVRRATRGEARLYREHMKGGPR
jgi:uncharacterized DUF497 family protein